VAKRRNGPGPSLALAASDGIERWDLPGDGEAVALTGTLAEITAYLTGRPHHLNTAAGEAAPAIPPWL